MKKYLILLAYLVISMTVSAQTVRVKAVVDERTELLSAVFRTVGAEEYKNNVLAKYTS